MRLGASKSWPALSLLQSYDMRGPIILPPLFSTPKAVSENLFSSALVVGSRSYIILEKDNDLIKKCVLLP